VSKKEDDPHITNKRIGHTYFWNVKRQRDGENNFRMMMKQPTKKKKKKKKKISCTKIIELKHLGKFMYKLRCMWENQDEIPVQDFEEMRQEVQIQIEILHCTE